MGPSHSIPLFIRKSAPIQHPNTPPNQPVSVHLISFQSDKHLEFRRQLNNINLNVIPIQSKLLLLSIYKKVLHFMQREKKRLKD